MKKLIVAALAIASAVTLNAASVDWSMSNGILSPSPDGSAKSGRCAYYTMLVFENSQADSVNTAIAAGNFTSLSGLAVSTSQAAKAGTFGGTVSGLTGESTTLFAVVFDTYSTTEGIADAGYYYKTGTITQNTYDPLGSDPATKAVFIAAQMTGTWTATAVPEPTSGLLMLLGMAGLALRRRRA